MYIKLFFVLLSLTSINSSPVEIKAIDVPAGETSSDEPSELPRVTLHRVNPLFFNPFIFRNTSSIFDRINDSFQRFYTSLFQNPAPFSDLMSTHPDKNETTSELKLVNDDFYTVNRTTNVIDKPNFKSSFSVITITKNNDSQDEINKNNEVIDEK